MRYEQNLSDNDDDDDDDNNDFVDDVIVDEIKSLNN